ncbi:unnamed protein product [Ectocarpus sp. 6 AP-2014]
MSFFTKGLAGIFNNGKARKKDEGKGSDKKKDKKDEGSWEKLTDVYGRTYWQHSKTGEWHFGYGGGFVPPVGTVNPSPMGYPGGPVFTPSPVPGGTLFPVAVAAPPGKEGEGQGVVGDEVRRRRGQVLGAHGDQEDHLQGSLLLNTKSTSRKRTDKQEVWLYISVQAVHGGVEWDSWSDNTEV